MPSEFTPNNVWGSTTAEGVESELTLPSGQTCRARRVTIESLLTGGVLNDVDTLTATVAQYTEKVRPGGKLKKANAPIEIDASILSDSATMTAMILMVDKCVPSIVVSPSVLLHFTERTVGKTTVRKVIAEEDRTPGAIYTDQIDLVDKFELFEWGVGGLKAFQSFRGEPTTDVGRVVPVAKSGKASKRNAGSN
jgi:hypothetical protein